MAEELEKIKYCKCVLPDWLYVDFTKKITSEGATIQDAIFQLILNYTEGIFDIEEK